MVLHFRQTQIKSTVGGLTCTISLGTTNKKILANPKYKKPTGFTLKSFIENHPVGRFVLVVEGHAMACVDGVLYGNPNERQQGLYRSVWYGFEMK